VKDQARLAEAVRSIVEGGSERLGADFAERPRAAAQRLLFVESAIETERAYTEIFSALAREHGAYVLAGSLCVPPMDESPHRGGQVILDDSRIHNVAYLFSPRGLCLGRLPKVHIPSGEDRLIDGAPLGALLPIDTRIGRIGTLLCFDGYHHVPIETYDAAGVDILVQPLYFDGPDVRFDGSGTFVPMPLDFVSLIQGRENVQYGVVPFLVGAIFEDERAEGTSFIARNTGVVGTPPEEALVAKTDDVFAEAIVAATVELAETGRRR
jgi:predicted amidohydrolase